MWWQVNGGGLQNQQKPKLREPPRPIWYRHQPPNNINNNRNNNNNNNNNNNINNNINNNGNQELIRPSLEIQMGQLWFKN